MVCWQGENALLFLPASSLSLADRFLPWISSLRNPWARGAVIGQILLFGGLFVLLGSIVGKLLTRNARLRQGQRYVTGGVYIVLGVTAAVTGSEHK